MLNALWVGLGGFIGSILRYFLNAVIYRLLDYPTFPYGILTINVLGCLIIGFLGGLSESRIAFTPELRVFLFIGVLGGFTTFSSFGYDTFGLLRDGQFFIAFTYVFTHILFGLSAVWLGFVASRFF